MSYIGAKELKASDIRRFDVTGSTSATHTLTWSAPTEQSLIVTINGVKQHEDAYSVSGTTLTLTSALVSTDKLEVIGINDIGTTITPAQNSVTADTIADGAVTTVKMATDPTDASNLASGTVPTARLGSGTASSSTVLYGDSSWGAAPSSGLANVQFFTSSGTYTRSTDVSKIIVAICGGGGGGGGGRTSYGYMGLGGGGAGFCYKYISSAPSTATITIGSGGAGGAADTVGSTGGASSYADGTVTLSAGGGEGAHMGGWTDTAARGTASGGDLNVTGGKGGVSPYTIGTTVSVASGAGGACAFPFTNPGTQKHAEVGADGNFGSGGSGGGGNHNGGGYATSRTGGDGGGGCCIIWEYK